MTDDDLSYRRRKADEDLRAYLAGRPATIGSNADVVRIYHSHIVAMRKAGASWEEIGAKLWEWSGRRIAPATIKQYMTEINKGRMSLELSSTVRPQAVTLSAAPAEISKPIQDSREDQPREERSRATTASAPNPADESPMPGAFDPGADFERKRKT
ncbi:hypothetical protein [Bosea sp. (in: a-proteobacteria)]|uniref:hypothetical protein n=1 Tax=Bosea sp. (in: a-proteobacteria) TaxID=1871050 RepID=UPI003B3B11BB